MTVVPLRTRKWTHIRSLNLDREQYKKPMDVHVERFDRAARLKNQGKHPRSPVSGHQMTNPSPRLSNSFSGTGLSNPGFPVPERDCQRHLSVRVHFVSVVLATVSSIILMQIASAKEEIPANVVAGKKVGADATLKVGDKLVGEFDKKDYLVEVIQINRDKTVKIHWIGFDKSEDSDVATSLLYFPAETAPTRKTRTSPLPAEYQSLDKDGDGQIGLYEWARSRYAEFKKLDKNHDGFLTPKELAGKSGAAKATPPATNEPKVVKEAKPDPGNLTSFNDKLKESFHFSVTGRAGGMVCGSGPYNTASELAAAVVHAGLVKEGVTAVVAVTIVESPDGFKGSAANGVTSVEGPKAAAGFTVAIAP